MHVRVAALVASLVVTGTQARAQTRADTTNRSVFAAGLASAMLPGLGSWYAGDDHHAIVHGATATALLVTGRVMSNSRQCDAPCNGERDTAAWLVFMAFVTNQVWATVVAVHDARAHNDHAAELRAARLDFRPTFRIAAQPGDAGRFRVEMRVLRVGL
jgi:hypothetical protein